MGNGEWGIGNYLFLLPSSFLSLPSSFFPRTDIRYIRYIRYIIRCRTFLLPSSSIQTPIEQTQLPPQLPIQLQTRMNAAQSLQISQHLQSNFPVRSLQNVF